MSPADCRPLRAVTILSRGAVEFFREDGRMEIEPPAFHLAGIEDLLDEFPLGGGAPGEDFLLLVEQLGAVGGVESAGGLDDAVDFQIGHHGGDNAGADVADGGEFVRRDVEHGAEAEHAVDEISQRARRGGVGVDEVLEDGEVVAAG